MRRAKISIIGAGNIGGTWHGDGGFDIDLRYWDAAQDSEDAQLVLTFSLKRQVP